MKGVHEGGLDEQNIQHAFFRPQTLVKLLPKNIQGKSNGDA
jgi:hypothetical protein